MTSIHSLPLELLHLIFHWATHDYALSANVPSWKHYTLTYRDGEDPWPTLYLGREREETVKALRLTCTRWTALATEFELYYLMINDALTLKCYLGRIRKLLQKDGEGGNEVNCPVRLINLRVPGGPQSVWNEEDTEMIVSLIRDCPNLDVMINSCGVERETHAAGPIILQSLVSSCPKLKHLHWKPKEIMQLLPSSWSSILASTSLARSLEFLEIITSPFADADEPAPVLTSRLELPSLQCLQLSVDYGSAPLAPVIAEQWQLPSLTSLYLQSSYKSIFTIQEDIQVEIDPGAISLISTHGQLVTTLAIDSSWHTPLHILPPAPIQELVYHIRGLEISASIPFTTLSTLVFLIGVGIKWPLITAIWRSLERLRKLQDHSLPKLKKIVVLSLPFDDLKEPHPIDLWLLDETQRLLVEPWQQETPKLVNRNGVRLFKLVERDQD